MSDANSANVTTPGIEVAMPASPSTRLGLASQASTIVADGTEQSDRILIVEQTLNVSKRANVTGRIRVSTRTETYDDVAEVTLDRNVVDGSRVPIGQVVFVAPVVRTEGDTTIVPVSEERLVVVKQLYLKEELQIRHHIESELSRTPVQLRRQIAIVERLDANGRAVVEDPAPKS